MNLDIIREKNARRKRFSEELKVFCIFLKYVEKIFTVYDIVIIEVTIDETRSRNSKETTM